MSLKTDSNSKIGQTIPHKRYSNNKILSIPTLKNLQKKYLSQIKNLYDKKYY